MLLNNIFDKRAIKLNLEGNTKEEVFTELIEAIADVHPEFGMDEMLRVIWDRENKMNTSIAPGAAVPHGYYPGSGDVVGAIGVSRAGIEYDALDHKPVHFIFLLIMGETSHEKHLHVLSRILSLTKSGALTYIQTAKSHQEVYAILSRFN
jgi:mannitol/fructose-specific phosphotransferase system IIA component (Ntr-type)